MSEISYGDEPTQPPAPVEPSAPLRMARFADRNEMPNNGVVEVHNGVLFDLHDESDCEGQQWGCWIHRPLPHPLTDRRVIWNRKKRAAERACEHDVAHPDPQDAAYWWNTLGRDVSNHACDGCCHPTPEWADGLLPRLNATTVPPELFCDVVSEDNGDWWGVYLAGVPFCGEGATREEALDDAVVAARGYSQAWATRLRVSARHARHATFVSFIDAVDDSELRRWFLRGRP